jgi:SAM-dependent methyltransferase
MKDVKDSAGYRGRLYAEYGSTFQSAPERFDEAAASRWGRAYRWYLRGYLPEARDARIVDLGCGYGRLLHLLREEGYSLITGVDISPDQTRRAREVVPDVQEMGVLDYLACHPMEFDLISALDLVEHLDKCEVLEFVDACMTALQPGGRLVLQTPNADSPFGMAHRYNDLTHEVAFNCNAISRLLAGAGFVDVRVRELGPVPWGYSLVSTGRYCAWQIIRAGVLAWNLVETGEAGCGVVSRNLMVSAQRSP